MTLAPGWELRLRRILKELMGDALPDPRERGLPRVTVELLAELKGESHRGG